MPKYLNPTEMQTLLSGVSPEISNAVNTKVKTTLDLFGDKFDRTFDMPEITYDLKGRTAGQAIGSKHIRLNPDAFEADYDGMINQTVPHEVAHIVQHIIYPHSKSHGYEWVRLMLMLDLMPNRTHTYKLKKSRVVEKPYTVYCECGPHQISRTIFNRMYFDNLKYRCKRCSAILKYEPYHE